MAGGREGLSSCGELHPGTGFLSLCISCDAVFPIEKCRTTSTAGSGTPFKGPGPWPCFKSRDTSPGYCLLRVRGFAPWGFSKLLGFTSSNLCPLLSPPSRSQPCSCSGCLHDNFFLFPFHFVVTILYMIFSLCSNN